MNKKPSKFWEMKKSSDKNASIYIEGAISSNDDWSRGENDTSASEFRDDLKGLGDVSTIELHINSEGGSVFEGIAIYNMLKNNPAHINVHVDALAASIASVIAMSGDTIFMPKNSMLMIHNPWTMAVGNAKELRKQADDLDQIAKASRQSYLQKAGDKLDEEALEQLLDDETWLTADEAYDYGLADVVEEANQVAASIDEDFIQKYKHVPKQLAQTPSNIDEEEERQAVQDYLHHADEVLNKQKLKLKENF